MKISELIRSQGEWESERGIVNGNYGLDRTMTELFEAYSTLDIFERLGEMIDVLICTGGSLAALGKVNGLCPEQIENMIKLKLRINEIKYNLKYFENRTPDEAQEYARYVWNLEQGEFGTPNDVY